MPAPWPPYPFPVERYCVNSGRPVRVIPGDRCITHGAASRPCATDVRPAQCQHPHPSPNHPTPTCAECGRPFDLPSDEESPADRLHQETTP